MFGYDEEGRLVKIERDYGSGGVQVAYEYGYNSDGVRVWKRDYLAGQEYRYICRTGCGGVPMRVYSRAMSGGSWASVEDYLGTPTVIGYTRSEGTFGHYVWLSGHWLGDWTAGGGWAYYQDQFGVEVGTMYIPAALPKPAPEYLARDEEVLNDVCEVTGYIAIYALSLQAYQKNQQPSEPKRPSTEDTPYKKCLKACQKLRSDLEAECERKHAECVKKCGGDPKCKKRCDHDLADCVRRANMIASGCAKRCDMEHDIPPGGWGWHAIPTGPYDNWCHNQPEHPHKKYPGLPTPGEEWIKRRRFTSFTTSMGGCVR